MPVNLLCIIENIRLPLDEGIRKASYQLLVNLNHKAPETVFACSSANLPGITFITLPKNNLYLDLTFIKKLRKIAPASIFYIPKGSLTATSLFRIAVLRFALGKKVKIGYMYNFIRRNEFLIGIIKIEKLLNYIITQSYPSYLSFAKHEIPVHLIPNGVDLDIFKPISTIQKNIKRNILGFSETDKIILHVGHITKRRNIHELAGLTKHGYKLLIIGSSSTPQDLVYKKLLQNYGFTVITDYIDKIEEYYQISDCYIFPVRLKDAAIDSPLSVLEALACHIPVVSTRFGDMPEMSKENSGIHIYDNAEELPEKVNSAIFNKSSTNYLNTKYSWSKVVDDLLKIIDKEK